FPDDGAGAVSGCGEVVFSLAKARRRKVNLEMYCSSADAQGGFLHGFSESRMRVAGARDVFAARAEFYRIGAFGDQVACARADDMNAEDAVGLGIGEHLHAAFGAA